MSVPCNSRLMGACDRLASGSQIAKLRQQSSFASCRPCVPPGRKSALSACQNRALDTRS